jgi:hypothetical protein
MDILSFNAGRLVIDRSKKVKADNGEKRASLLRSA